MQRIPFRAQLPVRLLASFVVVLLGNVLYANYAIHRALTQELPNVELLSLTNRGARLQVEIERSYARHDRLSIRLLERAPQVPLRLYDARGQVIEESSPFAPRPAIVRQVLASQPARATILTEGSQRYGYQVLPLYDGGTIVGALEVADELPPSDRIQASIQRELALITGVSICSLVGFGVYLGVRFRQSLGAIKQQTEAIVRGDFDQRVPIHSRDEIGQIASYLNQMAEDLGHLSKTRNEFFSKVSHELRTPLTIAKGFSSLLMAGPLLPQQERTVGIIDGQIDDLTRLVNDLLDLSRRQHSNLDLQTQEIDCATLIAEVVEQQRAALHGTPVRLDARYGVEHAHIKGDRQRLHQILGNLIGNARRYSRSRITLELDANDSDVIMRVRDDGPGIAAADLPRIFEPFFQSRHGRRGQAGLGLTVVRELTLAHGGTVDVESVPDEGTTFVLRFPRSDARVASRRGWLRFHHALRPEQPPQKSAHHA